MMKTKEKTKVMEKLNIDAIIGIDPGANGGIALYRPGHPLEVKKMPKDMRDLMSWLQYLQTICKPLAFIEKVQIRHDDTDDNPGKVFRIKNMIANYEQLKTTVDLCGVPFCLVHPMKWQNALNLRIRQKGFHEEKAVRKRRYRDIAGELYPEIKATLWNADAALLVHFGRYMVANDIKWIRENTPERLHNNLF